MDPLCSVDGSRCVKNGTMKYTFIFKLNVALTSNKQAWPLCGLTFLYTGLIIYFCYGVQHSVQKQRLRNSHNQVRIHSITTAMEQNFEPEQDLNV